MDIEGIKTDGIPIQDYNRFTSKTIYNDGLCISETPIIEEGIFLDGVKITTVEEWNKAIEEFRKREKDFIPKQKVRDKIEEWDKSIKWNNSDDHYYAIKILKELLGE